MVLQPVDIANFYSLVQIEARIAELNDAILAAAQARVDQFDDMQARQKVERQGITELQNHLGIWLKAWAIKTGATSASAELIAANYNPGIPKI